MCIRDLTEMAAKLTAAIGGFMGGTSILVYMPAKDWVDAARRVGVSVTASVMLSSLVAEKVFDKVTSENLMGTAFCIGFGAWFLLGSVARFFENKQGKDILQITKDVKNGTDSNN